MDEDFFAAVFGDDEAETLLGIEPLDGAVQRREESKVGAVDAGGRLPESSSEQIKHGRRQKVGIGSRKGGSEYNQIRSDRIKVVFVVRGDETKADGEANVGWTARIEPSTRLSSRF